MILYYVTLQSHYQRAIEEHPDFYRPPGAEDLECARNRQQLGSLIEGLHWGAFPEKDRDSDGLILCIDSGRAFPTLSNDRNQGLTTLVLALPTSAIVETITVPQRESRFVLPDVLPFSRSRSRGQRLAAAGRSMLQALAPAFLLGLAIAAFPKLFPSESASRWLTYFLANASFLTTLSVSLLAAMGIIYMLLLVSRTKVQVTLREGTLVPIGDLLRFVEPLDPGPDVLRTGMFLILGAAFCALAGLGVSLWYRRSPIPPLEFQVSPSGDEPRLVLASKQVVLPSGGVMDIAVRLPPNLTSPTCQWSTAAKDSLIYEHTNCQAVYWAQETVGQDRVDVEIYRSGRQLTRASLMVAVKPADP